MRTYLLFFGIIVTICPGILYAQPGAGIVVEDSVKINEPPTDHYNEYAHPFSFKKMILPASLITYGVLSVSNHTVGELNSSTRYEISEHRPARYPLTITRNMHPLRWCIHSMRQG